MTDYIAQPSKLWWKFLRFTRQVWVRVTMISVLALVVAGIAPLLQWLIPESLAERLGHGSVRPILNVLASSMLTVTTFSLSVMIITHRAASDQVTPRTHRLLLADTTTQTVLATFLGAFIYALASIILLNAAVFSGRSVAVSFFATIFVIFLVVVAILRWIEHLSQLGSMLETTRTVERAAQTALKARQVAPFLGGRPAWEAPAGLVHTVYPDQIGYIAHIDTPALRDLADSEGCDIHLRALPGTFVVKGRPLADISQPDHDEKVRLAFTIGDARSFDQDPRFGLIVLSEIASRALSPGINDPGTAIDVVGRVLRLLSDWQTPTSASDDEEGVGRLYVPALETADLVEDGFGAVARDGAGVAEVQIRLQKALSALAAQSDPPMAEAARALSRRALDHAKAVLSLPADLDRVIEALPAAIAPDVGDKNA